MALSTEDLGTGSGSGQVKSISPGNHRLKINSINLEDFQFIDGAKHLILQVETEPIDGFEGFMIDKDDASKGNYAGQIGKVKASQYAYANGETKTGVKINRDRSILVFLQNMCKTMGINEWFVAQHNKHETIDDFVNAFNKTAPFKDVYLDFCIGGKEYQNKNGYTSYELWLPKMENGKYSFGEIDSLKVIKFAEDKHVTKPKPNTVNDFGSDDDIIVPKKSSSDFNLD